MNTTIIYLISALGLLIAGYLVFMVQFPHDYSKRGRLSPFALVTGSAIYFAWGGFPYIYGIPGWPGVSVHPILKVIGWVFLWGGLALLFICMGWLGFLRSLGQEQTALIRTGPYRFSRNPQVVGCIAYGLGFVLLWPSWYALGWFALIFILTYMMVRSEEAHLHQVYGEAYQDYCLEAPRFIIWIDRL